MDINFHTNSLLSIRLNNNTKEFFFELFKGGIGENNLFLILSRPNYKISDTPKFTSIVYKDKKCFELILKLNGDMMDKISSIEWAWTSYEFFQLLVTEKEVSLEQDFVLNNSGKDNANLFEGYTLYRGVEENVLWIEKSHVKEYNELSKLLFSPLLPE